MRFILSCIKWLFVFVLLVIFLIAMSIPVSRWSMDDGLPEYNAGEEWMLKNIHIVDVENGKLIRDQQLHIRDGKIIAIAPNKVAIQGQFKQVDGQGRYLSPGLMDMHVHISSRHELSLNLAYGVTTVRNMRGFPIHLRWREELARGQWLGATLLTSSPVLDGPKYAHALQQVVTTAGQGRKLVRRYKAQGFDVVKVYGYLEDDVLLAILDEAKIVDIAVTKHGPHANKLKLNTLAGLESLEHVEDIFQGPLNYQFDLAKLEPYLQELKAIEPNFTATIAAFDHLTELSDKKQSFVRELDLETINPFFMFLETEFSVNRWLAAQPDDVKWNIRERDLLFKIIKRLDEEGVNLLVGSDAGTLYMTAGFSTHREMQLMQQAGLNAATVLAAATINAAEALKRQNELGSIAKGKQADMILSDSNPLEDISVLEQPYAVIKSGQLLDQQALKDIKTQARNGAGAYIGLGYFLEDVLGRWWQGI